MDLEQIKKNYADLSDFKLEYLAKNEINSLEPEVIVILVEEIKRRGLNLNLMQGIAAQAKELSEEEIMGLKSKISSLPCPSCRQKDSPLIGTYIRTVLSFIVFTTYQKKAFISCISCASQKRKNAIIKTTLFGWWGFPFGFFYTLHAIITSLTDSKNRDSDSEAVLSAFVVKNLGEIISNWDNEEELVDFINYSNP